MKKCPPMIAVAILVAACAQDPHRLVITEQNKDNFLEPLKEAKGLTVEEVGLLVSLQMRRGMTKGLTNTEPPSLVGKTIDDLLQEERRIRAEATVKEEQEKKLAADAKAKADALVAELRKAITLTVFDKGFIPSDASDGQYYDYITVKCAYENTSGKAVRAFTGSVQFADLFGKEIFTTTLTVSTPIAEGAKATWSGQIRYNQFIREQQSLRNTKLEDMKVTWLPASVLFADGSTIGGQ